MRTKLTDTLPEVNEILSARSAVVVGLVTHISFFTPLIYVYMGVDLRGYDRGSSTLPWSRNMVWGTDWHVVVWFNGVVARGDCVVEDLLSFVKVASSITWSCVGDGWGTGDGEF